MKLTIKDGEAKELMDLLADVQPGTTLADMRDRVQRAVEGSGPRRQLTGDELDVTVRALLYLRDTLNATGNPDAAVKSALGHVNAALPKVGMLRDIQCSREADGSQG